jgi:hypothetical protein
MTNNTTDFNLTFHQYMGLISNTLAFLEQLLRGTEYITYKVMTMETITKGTHLNHCCSSYSQHFHKKDLREKVK